MDMFASFCLLLAVAAFGVFQIGGLDAAIRLGCTQWHAAAHQGNHSHYEHQWICSLHSASFLLLLRLGFFRSEDSMRLSVSDARNGTLLPTRATTATMSTNGYVRFILPPSCCCCVWGFSDRRTRCGYPSRMHAMARCCPPGQPQPL